ncbi:MAG: DUF4388 domain-containing protein [Myxococcales bacterium]|nr:DUF4388 domain-containing protein [Myxococcales bacterium]
MPAQQTILILDGHVQRVGMLEQALNQLGVNVFRTSRAREAVKLFGVVKPVALVIATEGEGAEFYRRYVASGQLSQVLCVVLQDGSLDMLRPEDITLDGRLAPDQIARAIYQRLREHLKHTPSPEPTLTSPSAESEVAGLGSDAPSSSSSLNLTGTRGSSSLQRNREWKGQLAQLDVARLFSILLLRKASGKLLLSKGQETRRVWMNQGVLLAAESNMPLQNFERVLQKEGILKKPPGELAEHRLIFQKARPGEKLYELGLIDRASILRVNRRYVEQVVISSFGWVEGNFCFIPGAEDLPAAPFKLDIPPLLLQGIRGGYSARRLLSLLGSVERVPQWFSNRLSDGQLPLNILEKKIIQHINGRFSLLQLQQELRIEGVVLHALIYALMVLGHVTMADSPGSDGFLSVKVDSSGNMPVAGQNPAARRAPGITGNQQRVRPGISGNVPRVPLRPGTMTAHAVPQARKPEGLFQVEDSATAAEATRARVPHASAATRQASSVRRTQNMKATMTLRSMGAFQQGLGASYESQADTQKTQEKLRSPEELQKLQHDIQVKYQLVMTADYFQILGLDQNANELDIRRAYQQSKSQFAPEQMPSMVREKWKMQLDEIHTVLQEAYDVLGDGGLRGLYREGIQA